MLIPKQVGESKDLKQRPLTLPVDADTSLGGYGSYRESNTDEKVSFFGTLSLEKARLVRTRAQL